MDNNSIYKLSLPVGEATIGVVFLGRSKDGNGFLVQLGRCGASDSNQSNQNDDLNIIK